MNNIKFLVGQRVIYGNVICIVVTADNGSDVDEKLVWIDNPEKGYKHWASINNVKALPNGQL